MRRVLNNKEGFRHKISWLILTKESFSGVLQVGWDVKEVGRYSSLQKQLFGDSLLERKERERLRQRGGRMG